MSNGELIREIGELMDNEKMKVSAYRRLMLKATAGLLDKQDDMDAKLSMVCKDVAQHETDIEKLQRWDKGIGVLAVIGSVIAGVLGRET